MKEALLSIIKDENRIITGQIDPQYLSDNLGRKKGTAEAVVFPVSTEEISGVMRYAWKNNLPVTPRGAGTNLVGSTVPSGHGIVLDVSLMNHILELDEETFTATVEPGVVLEDFQAYVESKGLFYPPDPGEKKATIGGNISTNAGGMRAVKYGVTRDYVMGVELVLADGTVVMAGSKNRKDTSGLDLKEIVIGSEGTLAVITKCILKLIPKPEDSLSVLLSFDSLKAGIESVRQIIQANLNPTAMEFIERKVIQLGEDYLKMSFPEPEASAYVRSYNRAYLDNVCERFEKVLKGAAMMTETEVEIIREKEVDNKIPVLSLNDIVMEQAKAVNAPRLRPAREKTGSTDFGNVMRRVPGTCARIAFVPEGAAAHSQEYIEAGKTKEAHDAVIFGAKIIAGSAWELIEKPELLAKVKEEFRCNLEKENSEAK